MLIWTVLRDANSPSSGREVCEILEVPEGLEPGRCVELDDSVDKP